MVRKKTPAKAIKGKAVHPLKMRAPVKILFVEDEPDVLGLSKIFLEIREGLVVDKAQSAKEALKKLGEGGHDAVVADYKMPEMNGIEFLETIRRRGFRTPFIMFTGRGGEEIAIEAFNKGANAYISKGGAPTFQFSMLAREIREVVGKMRVEERLVQEQELVRELLDTIPDTIYFKDKEHRFVLVSKSQAELLGARQEDIVGKTDFNFFPKKQAKQMSRDEIRVMATGKPLIYKEEYITTAKGEGRWVSVIKIPRRNDRGEIIGITGVSRDITRRKKAEERIELLYLLLGHDVGNKILVARGYLELLKDTKLSSEQKKMLKKSLDAIAMGSGLIEKVKKLRQVKEGDEVGAIDLDSILKEAISENSERARDKKIEIKYLGTDSIVHGSPLLKEAFSNLIENSVWHAGCKRINILAREKDDVCTVTIEDDGKGIPDGIKKAISKPESKGGIAGGRLGLRVIQKIVGKSRGSIRVMDSRKGGVRFDIKLKCSSVKPKSKPKSKRRRSKSR